MYFSPLTRSSNFCGEYSNKCSSLLIPFCFKKMYVFNENDKLLISEASKLILSKLVLYRTENLFLTAICERDAKFVLLPKECESRCVTFRKAKKVDTKEKKLDLMLDVDEYSHLSKFQDKHVL